MEHGMVYEDAGGYFCGICGLSDFTKECAGPPPVTCFDDYSDDALWETKELLALVCKLGKQNNLSLQQLPSFVERHINELKLYSSYKGDRSRIKYAQQYCRIGY